MHSCAPVSLTPPSPQQQQPSQLHNSSNMENQHNQQQPHGQVEEGQEFDSQLSSSSLSSSYHLASTSTSSPPSNNAPFLSSFLGQITSLYAPRYSNSAPNEGVSPVDVHLSSDLSPSPSPSSPWPLTSTSSSSSSSTASSSSSSTDSRPSLSHRLMSLSSHVLSYISSSFTHSHHFSNSPAFLLGKCYKLLGREKHGQVNPSLLIFHSHYLSIPWLTYRSDFPPLLSSSVTSDRGWGCMLRSAQMMMAHALITHCMGKQWRLGKLDKKKKKNKEKQKEKHQQHAHDSNSECGESETSPPHLHPLYIRVLSLFFDAPSSLYHPFGVHSLLVDSSQVGEWFGPHQVTVMMARALQRAKQQFNACKQQQQVHTEMLPFPPTRSHSTSPSHSHSTAGLTLPELYISDDGTLYLDKIREIVGGTAIQLQADQQEHDNSQPSDGDDMQSSRSFSSSSTSFDIPPPNMCYAPSAPPSSSFRPLIIFIPLRLGVDKLNPCYYSSLLSLFQFPSSLGIMGGKPRSSLYFVGVQDDKVFYLDPHTVQPALHSEKWSHADQDSVEQACTSTRVVSLLASYQCHDVRSINIEHIDPSLTIGFYIATEEELSEFLEQARLHSEMPNAVFHVADVSPDYAMLDGDDEEDVLERVEFDDEEEAQWREERDEDEQEIREESPDMVDAAAAMPSTPAPNIHDSLTNSPLLISQGDVKVDTEFQLTPASSSSSSSSLLVTLASTAKDQVLLAASTATAQAGTAIQIAATATSTGASTIMQAAANANHKVGEYIRDIMHSRTDAPSNPNSQPDVVDVDSLVNVDIPLSSSAPSSSSLLSAHAPPVDAASPRTSSSSHHNAAPSNTATRTHRNKRKSNRKSTSSKDKEKDNEFVLL